MSAIAALWYRHGHRDAGADIARMTNALALYGPDRAGQWRDGNIALGHCLMSVLPEDSFDRQPLVAGGLTMVAAVRLDNRAELAELLDIERARARLMADGQFILAAFEKWGEDCVGRLLGDFTFVIWNRAEQSLFCARDHLGCQPLVYFSSDRLFALASMPKGLFALPDVPSKLDEEEVVRRLRVAPPAGTGPEDAHVFVGVRTLPSGHCLTVTSRGESLRRYWAPDPIKRLSLSDRDCNEAFRELFDEAVRCRLRGVGEIASHLSGGLDSAAVTVTAARLLAGHNRELTAFTAAPRLGYAPEGANGWPWDESHAAAVTAARHANITHVVMRPDGTTPLEVIRRSLTLADRAPINPCNAVWDQQICVEAKRRGVRVLLTGQMGNFTISYDGMPRLAALFREGRWLGFGRELMALPISARQRIGLLARHTIPSAALDWMRRTIRSDSPSHTLLHPVLIARLAQQNRLEHKVQERRDGFALRAAAIFRVDLGPFRAATAAGWRIDSRDPTADRRIVDFCLALPEDQYLRHGVTRRLLRQAFANQLPPQILDFGRVQKGVQAADFHEQMANSRDELIVEVDRMANSALAARCLDLPRMRRLLEDWPKDGWRDADTIAEYRHALLRGLAVGCFIRHVEGGNG
jgi:asparagine synthase (glutamine-hydrolysing)